MLFRKFLIFTVLLLPVVTMSCGNNDTDSSGTAPVTPGPAIELKTMQDTSINQIPEAETITRFDESLVIADYLPLDRGNVWSYVKSGPDGEETEPIVNEVTAIADGWSEFGSFFGRENIGLKISTAGEIYINYGGEVGGFYNELTEAKRSDKPFTTPAGTFDDLIVFTMQGNGDFQFIDIYAKGVGLVFHHQESPRGEVSYTLKSAYVRGKTYPKSE